MNVNRWILRKIKSINFDRMKKIVSIISEENHKSKMYITFDMALNFLKRGSGYTDYFRGNYINLTKKEKDTFVTAKKFYKLLDYLNDDRYEMILKNKIIFNYYFSKYIRRDYLDLRNCSYEEWETFLIKKKNIFAKNPLGEGGKGITKICLKDYSNKKQLYDSLKEQKQYLVEEEIIQCEELNRFNPHVVSSFRVITLYKDETVYVINNALRMNQGKENVIGSTKDLYFQLNENGKICSNVIDDYGNIYKEHPLTHKKFSDLSLKSDVKKAFKLCKEAAYLLPEIRYIGWDVAFTNNGPLIVEGNEYPGYGIIQYYKMNKKITGHLKEIENILKEEMKKIDI